MSADERSVEEQIEYNLMVSFFGGGYSATRGANTLWKKGIWSMAELDKFAKELSPSEFRDYLRDLRGVGQAVLDCILKGLDQFRKGVDEGEFEPEPRSDSRKNFRRRLYWTAQHVRKNALPEIFEQVKDGRGEPAGLTSQDIILLAKLLGKK